MFEDDSFGGNDRVSKEFEIKKWLEKTDIELFEMDANVPDCVRNSQRYTKRRDNFVKNYIDEQEFQNSQDILQSFPQNPKIVKDSGMLKRKLDI